MVVVTPTQMVVFGDPDDAGRGVLSRFAPAYFDFKGGFVR